MEFKGTKGKWEIHTDEFENNNIISNGYYLGEARRIEDAKLIASAPEMFAFLRDLYEQEQCISQSCHDELIVLLTKITK